MKAFTRGTLAAADFLFAVTFPFHPYTDGRRGGDVTVIREYAQVGGGMGAWRPAYAWPCAMPAAMEAPPGMPQPPSPRQQAACMAQTPAGPQRYDVLFAHGRL